jgi:hypothetical protein
MKQTINIPVHTPLVNWRRWDTAGLYNGFWHVWWAIHFREY